MLSMFSAIMVDGDGGYVIAVQEATDRAHQRHLVLHELAHLVFGTFEPAGPGQLATHRTGNYANIDERDAEFFAREVGVWIHASADAALPAQSDERAARLDAALRDTIGW
ncbi:hypothetical protein CRH09_39900 (plasmid) [Nocardia terpenica]|uniref:IrrE N-terminal-like domain-containing protein n=1 Tax=Nocardia terpenica TaxID=455432 RepID=A0A291RYC7_9NOCA|nr:hypothetical protein CRH09_39900 [Nocardia terpenica]